MELCAEVMLEKAREAAKKIEQFMEYHNYNPPFEEAMALYNQALFAYQELDHWLSRGLPIPDHWKYFDKSEPKISLCPKCGSSPHVARNKGNWIYFWCQGNNQTNQHFVVISSPAQHRSWAIHKWNEVVKEETQ